MNAVKTFEQFDKKVKELEREKIRAEEQYERAKIDTNTALKELLELTGTKTLNDAVEHMKKCKAELGNLREQLDEEIQKFNDRLYELDSISEG